MAEDPACPLGLRRPACGSGPAFLAQPSHGCPFFNTHHRWLSEGEDGLFRPTKQVWEEKEGALVDIRTQRMDGKAPGPPGRPVFKLLTLRSRILDTDLVD